MISNIITDDTSCSFIFNNRSYTISLHEITPLYSMNTLLVKYDIKPGIRKTADILALRNNEEIRNWYIQQLRTILTTEDLSQYYPSMGCLDRNSVKRFDAEIDMSTLRRFATNKEDQINGYLQFVEECLVKSRCSYVMFHNDINIANVCGIVGGRKYS